MFPADTRILVIDDMMTMRKIVRKNLTDMGFTSIAEADDGETAWPMIQKAATEGKPYQLIISDWNMPKLKGIDLLRQVRALESIKTTPFVLLTAEAEKTQILEALKAGVTNYITKPFTPATLGEKIKAVYDKVTKK